MQNMVQTAGESPVNPALQAIEDTECRAKVYHAAIYARLSYETEANRKRDTVETQVAYLKNFIDRQEDMELADIYADVSFSGTNFERPEFERMMRDIRAGKIDTVITKDLSRLGRNYIDSGIYIERIFPLFHVRYIAVNDDFDTNREGTDLTMPLKNIINEWYARDLLNKMHASYQTMQKQRYMERSISATKRKLIEKQEQIELVTEPELKEKLQKDYDKLAYRMTEQNKAYNDFCKANDLQPQYDRIKLADFKREQTRQANAGASRYRKETNRGNSKEINTLENQKESDIIKLSESEQHAINKYVSSESYVLNDKLRKGMKLSADEKTWTESLDSALDKMPEYKGIVYRSVSDFGIDNVDGFIKSHIVDGLKIFQSYTSTSKSVHDESFPIQYVIQSKHGKDISTFNFQEKEILFKRNSKFLVNKIEGNVIYMEEI